MKRIDDKYEVTRVLGEGGMGAVYEARHERTGRRVAIKVIKEELTLEESVVERFHREARAAGSIESDHITDVLDGGVDRDSGAPYLVMELLSGEDLDAAIKRLGPLKPDIAARVVAQMLMGLEKAHDAGVVHRDIKPANVFLSKKEGGAIVAKIGDFGVAKVKVDPLASKEHQLTRTSALLGSPAYMSPEQAKGAKDIDARADLWSTGVVLYQCLTGKTPHAHADTLGLLLLAICSEETPPVQSKAAWVSPDLAAVVTRALHLDIQKRFQSAGEMLRAILATLPNGAALDASMFVALTDDERGYVAESLPAIGTASTATGVTKSSEAPGPNKLPARRFTGVVALVATASLAIGAVVFWIVAPEVEPAKPHGLVSASTGVPGSLDPPPLALSSVPQPSVVVSAPPALMPDAAPAKVGAFVPPARPPTKPTAPVASPPTATPSTATQPTASWSDGGIKREWKP